MLLLEHKAQHSTGYEMTLKRTVIPTLSAGSCASAYAQQPATPRTGDVTGLGHIGAR